MQLVVRHQLVGEGKKGDKGKQVSNDYNLLTLYGTFATQTSKKGKGTSRKLP